MTVIDLIIQLQKLPQNMEVIIDKTKGGSGIFRGQGIEWVDEIETGTGDKYVFISSRDYDDEPSNN